MDAHTRSGTGGQDAALVILAFLQTDGGNSEYSKELLSLGNDFNLTRDVNCNVPGHNQHQQHQHQRSIAITQDDDGDLETDGHLPSCPLLYTRDLQPSVELQWLRNHEAAAELRRVAEELREIGAQIEQEVVARATRNLRRNISASPSEQWRTYLTREVEQVMRRGVGLEQLPQERVLMALTLTLVKGVCEQAPHFLRNLFNAALQYIGQSGSR
ncbi:BH3 interacting domain death agonist isoform X2 [Scophthalmus maximus]|uniref:BH3 interacting domain death agonist isoform X2 n=1 Tax=Scophthalmus maximus TaxID=52904 RepID=UPI0015E1039C|nr:BH3 interacting domain death agonist isoform X2 [Scophthalmus maximus]